MQYCYVVINYYENLLQHTHEKWKIIPLLKGVCEIKIHIKYIQPTTTNQPTKKYINPNTKHNNIKKNVYSTKTQY